MMKQSSNRWVWLGLAVAFALLASSVDVAAKKKRRRRKAVPTVDVVAQRSKVRADEKTAIGAIRVLSKVPEKQRREAADALVGELSLGLSPGVAREALGGLATLGQPVGPDLLEAYGRHRRARVRISALETLAALHPPRAERMIIAALGDREQIVRAAAAKLIAEKNLRRGIEPLLALLKRGEESVAPALGKLADAEVARVVAELNGVAPDALVSRALGAMLMNPKFGPEPLRLEVVNALSRVAGNESIEALTNYVSSVPRNQPRPSRDAAELAVEKRISEGAQ